MKKAFFSMLALVLACCTGELSAQISTPAASPAASFTQMVGLTEVSVEYSRPATRDREIFGGLVPYDEVWRLGANAATKISFSEDVMLGGKDLKAGEYAVLAKPGMDHWTLMLYPYTTWNFGAYLEGDVEPVMVMADVMKMEEARIENFMIMIDEITSHGANLYFGWDNTMAAVEIKVHTDKAVQAAIDRVMAGPTAGDYFNAASYYAAEGKNLEQALEWMNKSIEMGNERYWVLRQKSLLQAKLGDKQGAIATAKRSLELATEAGNKDYIRMNEASIKEWMM